MGSRPAVDALPPFVALAAHPVRWRLLVELGRSDRQVAELTERVGEPQNLVSYHLGRLRAGGLVSSRRSSFDGRASYYRAHLDRCGALLHLAGAALHPGLAVGVPTQAPHAALPPGRCVRVLFACTGNGSRSQLAEALLRRHAGATVEVVSGGSHPKPIHPNALAVLAERGIDTAPLRSKSLDEHAGRSFDLVVTLCDRVREVCPEFPGGGERVHWSIEDPSRLAGGPARTLPAFRALADDLDMRIAYLCALFPTDPRRHRGR